MENNLPSQLVQSLNGVFGKHKARAVHAKGIILTGSFQPSSSAQNITKAIHLQEKSSPVTIRFSNFAGVPTIPDNDEMSNPKGLGIKFHLANEESTDIVCHSFNGFPSPTALDFRNLLMALGQGGDTLNDYLEQHSTAKAFLTAHKPMPKSFATLPYYGVNAFKFINKDGAVRFGRYQVLPEVEEYYPDDQVKALANNFLMNEISDRVANKTINLRLVLQLANDNDVIDNPTVVWSDHNEIVELGILKINEVNTEEATDKNLMFLPGNLVEGIEAADPMVKIRDKTYPISKENRQ
ncbi:catalase family peroxidase [Flammeovirga agarivorans]|uniref:catalase n=1 Tax=Flammeovirga agarivorans TaxID=2726742 RepID=A0A7X8SKK8_9BACT|nr:catalase family peroxidase [Flammeovirga agarivorans]NLR91867.1 catalase family peroxidase [Flammeovirga agarivorans]